MAAELEAVLDRSVNREKLLRMPGRLELPHLILRSDTSRGGRPALLGSVSLPRRCGEAKGYERG
jgi:hypothetical protein